MVSMHPHEHDLAGDGAGRQVQSVDQLDLQRREEALAKALSRHAPVRSDDWAPRAWNELLVLLKVLRARQPVGRLYVMLDNFSPHRRGEIRDCDPGRTASGLNWHPLHPKRPATRAPLHGVPGLRAELDQVRLDALNDSVDTVGINVGHADPALLLVGHPMGERSIASRLEESRDRDGVTAAGRHDLTDRALEAGPTITVSTTSGSCSPPLPGRVASVAPEITAPIGHP